MSDNFNAGQLSFVDKEGHEWDVTITLAEAMRIDRVDFSAYTEHPVSMLRPSEEFKKELLDNPPLLFALMYYAVKPQADMLGLDEESFCQRIDGSCIEEACVAMLRSVANFIRAMATVLLPLADGLERAIAESRK
ncbi:MAG: hypothetical protein KDA99_30935, partial [Planctomycetales bacterium]|nr:hypothetical protein [Planctomycetales bacterium]